MLLVQVVGVVLGMELMRAVEVGGVHSLHDPTEGGVLNGIWEMAEAAGAGVIIHEKDIPVRRETRLICDALGIDPLKVLGSGALLMTVDPVKSDEVVAALRGIGVEASVIGEIKPIQEGRVLVGRDGGRSEIEAVEQDHLYKVLDEYGMGGEEAV